MPELSPLQRKILREVYLLKGRERRIDVARERENPGVVLTIGEKRLSSDRAADALSNLYSRGLVQQKRLNRFVLTKTGLHLAKVAQGARN